MKNNFDKPARGREAFISAAISILTLLPAISAGAQASASPERLSPSALGYIERARTMLDAKNYGGVIDQLKMLNTRDTDLHLLDALSPAAREEYIYMLAEALYQRGDSECLELLRSFERNFPASPLALKARLSIADFYFFNHQWEEALEAYDNVDFNRLNRSETPLYTYRKALTLLKTGNGRQARPFLHKIASTPEYRQAARFYEAYLDLQEGEIDNAYAGFSRVEGDVDGLDPAAYLAQIDYARGEYAKVIQNAAPLLRKNNLDPDLLPETNRIAGLSYFKTGDYENARKCLATYLKESPDDPAPDAAYALGVIDYEDGDYRSAAERFEALTDLDSDLGQSAWLYIGQCDLKTGNPDAAAMAFEKAAKLNYDPSVTETAIYNYAAALTRGGKIPFSSSATLMEQFIERYPDSEYTPKIEEYLASAYYNDRNYRKALSSINAIRKPSANVLAAKQKILYELGVECVANSNPSEGAEYLQGSIGLASHDRAIAAQSQLWLGDALYALNNFKGAEKAYAEAAKQIKASSNRTLAIYDQAYSQYMLGNYAGASRTFASALSASPALPPSLRDDATIRRADCLYYTGNYGEARTLYAQAIKEGAADADYASYRHAVMTGLSGDTKGKIRELSEMDARYPGSKWIPSAMLEKAMTYESLGQADNAASAFRDVSKKYPDAVQARKALLNLALSNSKRGRGEEAAEEYKEIIRRWPSSEEAAMANDDLKKYYASTGELREYSQFLQSIPGAARLDPGEIEQLAFDGAEIAYTDNSKNISLLQSYVREYPDGKYLAQALLDIAYSQEKERQYEEAELTLSHLIAERPHSPQAPEALLMKAELLEFKLGRTKDALLAYRELEKTASQDFGAEAAAGIMRTTTDNKEKLAYARKTRLAGGLSADQLEEASLIEAEALIKIGDSGEALRILERLSANPASEAGAKAAVMLAQYYLDTKQYKLAEQTALDFTDAGTPHEVELAKGFIALADAYHAQGQTLLAKEYLQSLRDNYPGKEPEILNAISSRLKSWK
ncbi:MAG: tetratricopeptide repeat protein [Muribaculaceae bacterium]|nr:tetratricopeptide repeat protein [Muribaculaceae bacterium]MDE6028334.1 tetratricopeptide repeat protein [Muribaculaceae bacterium]